ncbi:c-type cytochrome [Actibacterium pelagium]|uniref:Cytochrome c2 n=1 Tax=Actibacterium pelagium TaxID=2029103 RepID=A0A917AGN7_9RHOB|nr:c-type cytochrome [Actibacterium pelagium]GGE51871.1 cytochrome c2 [Actibacterium pelagium]
MKFTVAFAVTALLAAPAFAETPTGDATAGEKAFKKCVSCHVVKNDEGETLAGKAAKTGPNLYGIAGGAVGQQDFKYSKVAAAAAEAGVIMTEDNMVAFLADPSKYLSEAAGQKGRSKMSLKVKKEQDARDVFAYLYSLQPAPEAAEEATTN